jgi:hypothetical protein
MESPRQVDLPPHATRRPQTSAFDDVAGPQHIIREMVLQIPQEVHAVRGHIQAVVLSYNPSFEVLAEDVRQAVVLDLISIERHTTVDLLENRQDSGESNHMHEKVPP